MRRKDDGQGNLFEEFGHVIRPKKFDAKESASQRDDAEDRVERHADDEWKEAAFESVKTVARKKEFFTADDVQADLEHKPVETHELRALGPVMMRALKEKIAVQSGDFTRTTQVKCHRMPRRIWRSLIYD